MRHQRSAPTRRVSALQRTAYLVVALLLLFSNIIAAPSGDENILDQMLSYISTLINGEQSSTSSSEVPSSSQYDSSSNDSTDSRNPSPPPPIPK